MPWPRKGVLIRLAIYVPLIAFLGYNACTTWRARRDAEDVAAQPSPTLHQKLAPHKRLITLPDGTQQAVYELTPEEAQELLGAPVQMPGDDDAPPEPPPSD